jgi:hypothetical protein
MALVSLFSTIRLNLHLQRGETHALVLLLSIATFAGQLVEGPSGSSGPGLAIGPTRARLRRPARIPVGQVPSTAR